MRPEIREKLLKLLKGEESFRQFPYHDTKGILTVGFGRNLQNKGINLDEALYLLANDVQEAEAEIWKSYPHYSDLDPVRQAILVEMVFNMGIGEVLCFKNMFAHIEKKDWKAAAQDMLNSEWHKQVGHRAEVWSHIMECGEL